MRTPIEELAERHGLAFTLLVSPTTPDDRVPELVARCRGFVYLVARTGITGERDTIPEVNARVQSIRRHTDLPVALGFGISRPEHVARATAAADAAIVGTALVRRMGEAADPVAAAVDYAETLVQALVARAPA